MLGARDVAVALPRAVNLLKEERRRERERERKGPREKLGLESLDGGGGERARKLECVGSGLPSAVSVSVLSGGGGQIYVSTVE